MYGYMCRWLDLIVYSHLNMFNFTCINQIHNIEILSKLNYNVYGTFYSNFSSPTHLVRYCNHLQGDIIILYLFAIIIIISPCT